MKLAFPLGTILLYAILSGFFAWRSDGDCLDDDLCHYQIARASWRDGSMLWNVWGRPGFTLPHAAVANIGSPEAGFLACRLLNAAMMVATVCLAWLLARRIRTPFAPFVPLVMLLMPVGFSQSFTPNTEVPAALYATAGVYLLSLGRRRWAAIFFALLPATRHELIVFLVPLAVYFLWRRDVLATVLLGWFELIWNLACRHRGMDLPIERFFTPQDAALYGSGNALHYLVNWCKVVGVPTVILCLLGTASIARHEWTRGVDRLWASGKSARRARTRLLIAGAAIGIVILETFLFAFNHFASGGYAMFLIPGVGFMAICACYGMFAVKRALRPKLLPVAAAIALLATIGHWAYYLRPYRLTPHQALLGRAVAEMHRLEPGCLVIGHSAWISYFDEPPLDVPGLPAKDLWHVGYRAPLYYLYDDAPGFSPPLAEISCPPAEQITTLKIAQSDPKADLLVFRRPAVARH
jgi:hypothetical protein